MKVVWMWIAGWMLAMACAGCGHNISVYSKGVGAELAWRPNTIMPSIRFGSYENLDLVQKENNQVRYTSNSGVGFDWFGLKSLFGGKEANNAGTGTVLEVKTGPQINGYVADVLMNPEAKPEHVEIAKAVTGVQMDLGDKETHVSTDGASTNATPVVTTEKGTFGSVTVTTPTNQYTQDAIKEPDLESAIAIAEEYVKAGCDYLQVSNGIHDVMKAYGFYIICAVVVLILAIAFVIVHLLQKSIDLRKMVEDLRALSGR